jgi:hypothetical protein
VGTSRDCICCGHWYEEVGCINQHGSGNAATCAQWQPLIFHEGLAQLMFPECYDGDQ